MLNGLKKLKLETFLVSTNADPVETCNRKKYLLPKKYDYSKRAVVLELTT